MRRAHRRAHLALWIILAPAAGAALAFAYTLRPETPQTALPNAIAEESP